MSVSEADALIAYFESLTPIWERRHAHSRHSRDGARGRRITRPVYWLGAWQFASLGYYAEPDYREGRCLRGEAFPEAIQTVLERLRPVLAEHDCSEVDDPVPNTCLINYYGSELGEGPPRDQARLRMHRDGEPGPEIMFCIGQPGLLEFLEPDGDPELSLWTRHRSVVVFSGAEFKRRLYHRITRVRYGVEPALTSPLQDFALRRVSVSFRHVPQPLICEFSGLPSTARELVRPYVEALAASSEHYARQLRADSVGR